MSEMTVEQAIEVIRYRIATASEIAGSGGMEDLHMAIQALEENEAMKASNQNLFDIIGKLKDENEKLRIDHRHIYDQFMETEKDAQAEIARLNGIIEQLSNTVDAYINLLNNQMSAVEVLEFLMNDTLSVDNYWFHNYTPQEIVDKIQEHEKKSHISEANENIEKEKVTFKIITIEGSKEKPYYGILYQKLDEDDYTLGYGSYNLDFVREWYDECLQLVEEHTEPQKEEKVCESCDEYWYNCKSCEKKNIIDADKIIEWVWECDSDCETCDNPAFTTEQDAIDWCESMASCGYVSEYRKVCRRKEN